MQPAKSKNLSSKGIVSQHLVLNPGPMIRSERASRGNHTRDSKYVDAHMNDRGFYLPQIKPPTRTLDISKKTSDGEACENSPTLCATNFAQHSLKAGFLYKLGANVHQYKRRFFVLKPTTHLYYFISPNDSEPRGCIDLEHTTINELETLTDGRYRFEIRSNLGTTTAKSIILEARNQDIGKGWVKSLQEERLIFYKNENVTLERRSQQLKLSMDSILKEVENLRLIENDRDGAMQDAAEWKKKYETLIDAMHLLTRVITKKCGNDNIDACLDNKDSQPSDECATLNDAASLTEEERQLELISARNESFSALREKCLALLKSMKLTNKEANSSNEELQEAVRKNVLIGEKMSKAEKLICKLWEENCSIREKVKKLKQEKKILVNEVKSLIKQMDENQYIHKEGNTAEKSNSAEKRLINDLEEHLSSSLRLHEKFCAANNFMRRKGNVVVTKDEKVNVVSHPTKDFINPPTIKRSNTFPSENKQHNIAIEDPDHREQQRIEQLSLNGDLSDSSDTKEIDESFSPLCPKRLILPSTSVVISDEAMSSTTSNVSSSHRQLLNEDLNLNKQEHGSLNIDDSNHAVNRIIQFQADEEGSVSTIQHSYEPQCQHSATESSNTLYQNNNENMTLTGSSHEKQMIELEKNNTDERGDSILRSQNPERWRDEMNPTTSMYKGSQQAEPCSSIASSQSISSRSIVTDNGQATSKLFCPFAEMACAENEIFHLTFFNRKIGLQFQKITIAPNNGSLYEALKTDRFGKLSHCDQHRRVDIGLGSVPCRMRDKQSPVSDVDTCDNEDVCEVARPVDAVLVCGFNGFDNTGHVQKPSIGSRLVAFDGVSVEVGKWTFESVKKAIQARGRPITLSFRNDYLTAKQREVLAKAVKDLEHSKHQFPPKIKSTRLHSRDSFNHTNNGNSLLQHDYSPSNKISNQSRTNKDLTPFSSNSTLSNRSGFSSFSSPLFEGEDQKRNDGGSTILSATIGPLVAGIMSGLSQPDDRHDVYPPHYLQQSTNSLDNISKHQDFKAGLL